MVTQDRVLLMACVIGLYLYDSALLLYCNEGVLIPTGRKDWSVRFGFGNVRILGKEVFIPNPFLPHRPLFRLSWQFEGNSSCATQDWASRANALNPMAPMIWCMAVALFVLLPLGLFTKLGDGMLFSTLLLLYLSIIAALSWLWLHRAALELSKKRFAALAFEALVCSPFALNLIRAVSLGMVSKEDLEGASRRLQTPDEWNATQTMLVARLDEQIEEEESDSGRMLKLQDHRRTLTRQHASCLVRKSS